MTDMRLVIEKTERVWVTGYEFLGWLGTGTVVTMVVGMGIDLNLVCGPIGAVNNIRKAVREAEEWMCAEMAKSNNLIDIPVPTWHYRHSFPNTVQYTQKYYVYGDGSNFKLKATTLDKLPEYYRRPFYHDIVIASDEKDAIRKIMHIINSEDEYLNSDPSPRSKTPVNGVFECVFCEKPLLANEECDCNYALEEAAEFSGGDNDDTIRM